MKTKKEIKDHLRAAEESGNMTTDEEQKHFAIVVMTLRWVLDIPITKPPIDPVMITKTE